MSLVLVGLGLVMILGLAGISIDLASLYVTRNEEQRAADAAALAGANTFVNSGITIGATTADVAQSEAATQAVQVGNANLVIGRSPGLNTNNFNPSCPAPTGKSGGCFNFTDTNDPRITVQVYEQMPTYFMKIFGINSVPVSASATAEAYQPSGNGPASSAKCVKPWMMPNCDYTSNHMVDPTTTYAANENCPAVNGLYPEYFVYPGTPQPQVSGAPPEPAMPTSEEGQVVNPSTWNSSSTGGAIGELLTLKTGDPQQAPAPSQFYPVFLPDSNPTFECPSCALSDQQNSTSNSAARYREYIECCSNTQINCNASSSVSPIVLSAVSGNKVGPTGEGVDCLIGEGPDGTGQDTISWENQTDPTLPYTMYSGSTGDQITVSNSVVTVPLYEGQPLCPGTSCSSTVNVIVQGWLQLFIQQEGAPQHSVYAYVMNIAACGGTNNQTGGTTIPSTTGSPVPVRLIHN